MNALRFPFLPVEDADGISDLMPLLPIKLSLNAQAINVYGLLDTGASVSVLPFSIGISLGAVWDDQKIPLPLSGNLAAYEARALFLQGQIENLPPVRLAFAWTRADNMPLLLGQTNFFQEFDALFVRASMFFEISEKGAHL